MSCPFQLEGLCSCRFAEDGKEMHSWYYVGTSFPLPLNGLGQWDKGNCEKPAMRPSYAHTALGVKQGLCGIIRYASHVLKERSDRHLPKLGCTEDEDGSVHGQLPRHVAAPLVHGGCSPTVGGASADTRLAVTVPLQDRVASAPDQGPSDTDVKQAYPTDSKERENERRRRLKEEGQEVVTKKQKVHVEDHYDDCGEDLSSLVGATLIDGDGSDCTSAAESEVAHDEDLRAEAVSYTHLRAHET